MSKKKVKEGVCGLCGRAQVRPGAEEINKNTHGWLSGHEYKAGKLIKVRCFHHAEDVARLYPNRRLDCFCGWI